MTAGWGILAGDAGDCSAVGDECADVGGGCASVGDECTSVGRWRKNVMHRLRLCIGCMAAMESVAGEKMLKKWCECLAGSWDFAKLQTVSARKPQNGQFYNTLNI